METPLPRLQSVHRVPSWPDPRRRPLASAEKGVGERVEAGQRQEVEVPQGVWGRGKCEPVDHAV